MKKGFTLAEVLVTMLVLGIIAAVVVPLIVGMRPDKDKVTYKKALYSLQAAVSAISDDPLILGKPDVWADSAINGCQFCYKLSEALNIKGTVNCGCSGTNCSTCNTRLSTSFSTPNFTTTDGIRFWNLEGAFSSANADKEVRICGVTKKDGSNNTVCASNGSTGYYRINVRANGKVTVPSGAENDLLDDALNVRSTD